VAPVPFYSVPIYPSTTYVTPSESVTTSEPTSAAPQNAPPVTLILKDGRHIEAQGYALVGSTLWILDQQSATKIPLSDVDVAATQKENQQHGINVVIPSVSTS